MNEILKAAEARAAELTDGELALINRQALRPLVKEEVYSFKLAACDNQVDRDFERFTDASLEELAGLFTGKSVLMDHWWSAGSPTARVSAAQVEAVGEVKRLILRCYMPRTEQTAGTITAIETGILRECSVGCAVRRAVCSICGADQTKACCQHIPGKEYDGRLCVMALDGAADAYEVSLVAVPAQPKAGVVKSKRYGGEEAPGAEPAEDAGAAEEKEALLMARAVQEQEEKRYGGIEA